MEFVTLFQTLDARPARVPVKLPSRTSVEAPRAAVPSMATAPIPAAAPPAATIRPATILARPAMAPLPSQPLVTTPARESLSCSRSPV
jgi:hypothetical protein